MTKLSDDPYTFIDVRDQNELEADGKIPGAVQECHQIQNIISSNLKKNYTNLELAKLTNSTERNNTNGFKKTLNLTITDFKSVY